MHMKVMKEQFALDGDKLTHTPTGATFWLGDKDVVACEQGRLKLNAAWRIMARRKAGSRIGDSDI
jgi:hypothetical protein